MRKTVELKFKRKRIKSVFVVKEECQRRDRVDAQSAIMFFREKDGVV